MSKQTKLLNHLKTGASLTTRQIAASFGLANPQSAINQLRSQGHCIYGNRAVLADGTETTKYRIGTPSKRMIALANAAAGAAVFTQVM